nr:MAG TPA: hypothetical protein [Caudoviricetes sp.]
MCPPHVSIITNIIVFVNIIFVKIFVELGVKKIPLVSSLIRRLLLGAILWPHGRRAYSSLKR